MLYSLAAKKPVISDNAFIADTACIVGDVELGENSSIWFNAVVRGDRGKIIIGKGSNIQDNAVIHSDETGVEIGDRVSVGHGCVIHGCRIKDDVLVGMNATVLNGAEIGEFSIIGAGALVPQDKKIPAHSVVFGMPCKHVRSSTDDDLRLIKNTSKTYEKLAETYLESGNRG
ncbi:MAG: gamma carbonic anhydrase family protein [Candidatus Methanoperedens sp.]|jgi:carbonic anhydrase/acetyltransferase-like protein (isoleucine patch superfamily)|nr:gamma carbonic anhydrase family protein [Candidatus Methanoperedens sp.]PKL53077.1 MAG: gamma carbonic anhydrase family protein [Candidatus Methanoperedenaceae archaeon HGW-Methanoperedenaceae-1]